LANAGTNLSPGNPVRLIRYVEEMEKQDSRARFDRVLSELDLLGIRPSIQGCRFPRTKNVVVDFAPRPQAKTLIFSAHYDVLKGTPGANDNASGVAVLLGLCRELQKFPSRARVIFFDREEAWFRTRLLRLGLLGSLCYAARTDLRNVAAVYNLEFCGEGDSLAIWPVKTAETGLPAVNEVARAAGQLDLPFECAHISWPFISSDHLSFRLKRFPNAVTLSLLPRSQAPLMRALAADMSLHRFLTGWRPVLPGALHSIHSREDTSSRLSETSLQLMLSLLLALARNFSPGKA
jgi:hypothetical protein